MDINTNVNQWQLKPLRDRWFGTRLYFTPEGNSRIKVDMLSTLNLSQTR